MRILWLHQFFATPRGWGAVRTYEFARRFVRAGHAVDVVCCAGYDHTLKHTGREPLVVDGVRIFVSGTAYSSHMGFSRRVMSFLRFMADTLWFVLRNGKQYDLCIASSGPLTMAVPALIGRWLWRVPFIFEVIDVWPDSAIASGVLKNPVLKWLSFRLEALAYRHAAAIVTCSDGMTKRVEGKLGEKGEGEKTVVTISNCCDLETCAPDEKVRRAVRLKYGVREDQMVVLYSGAMGRSNAMEDVAEAVAGTATDERIVWWFAGDGPYCGHPVVAMGRVKGNGGHPVVAIGRVKGNDGHPVVAMGRVKAGGGQALNAHGTCDGETCGEYPAAQGFNLTFVPTEWSQKVRWFGRMAKEEVVSLVRAADVNVVTFRHEPLFHENSPNKFFDGIAAGLPAVFNRSTWLEPWLREYDCGIVCKGERPGEEMAEALRDLADDPERRQRMGAGARRLAEEVFDRDRLAEVYLGVIATVGLRS